jgi:hypothetical protein
MTNKDLNSRDASISWITVPMATNARDHEQSGGPLMFSSLLVPTYLISVNYGAMLLSSHTDNASSFAINPERISISLRRQRGWHMYLIFMRTLVATRCKSVQVVTGYQIADVPAVGTKSKGKQTGENLIQKGKNFVFASVHHRSGERD